MSIMLTRPQTRVLLAIDSGAAVKTYQNIKGKWCFSCDADGVQSILYLTLTCRALVKRKYLDSDSLGKMYLTTTGKLVADNS